MTSAGRSTTRPWPGASRAGSSARSRRADSRAIGRCHVKRAGTGERSVGRTEVTGAVSVA